MSDSQTLAGKSIAIAALVSGIGAVIHGVWQPNRYIKMVAGLIGSGAGLVYYLERR